ncbi:MAG: hypothetical protein CFH21_00596 [Alphaproteobacteria bacterium MarineAlpha5_Bin11]|nr:MAG: hypothetical protein CFH21_00596 [Alphaproteobacteria bacterium MarineAlpha5_Bin11]PPR50479.1 MAG: hypothetical protein CFH20_00938 [Alphaproteobacteria bacterium MarineAlpha5_Bin10]|tara:strand:+ start:13460 stop:14065 length:606 start_codon:yes stop_codon:yes gene_type:complete
MDQESLNPQNIFKRICSDLKTAVEDRLHEYHLGVFTNQNLENIPTSRTVVLRDFNINHKTLSFHSDSRSTKIREIKKNNECFFLFYSSRLKQQLRIKVVSSVQYNNIISANAWDKTSLMSRKCYLATMPPGSDCNIPTDGIPKHLQGKEPDFNESENGYVNFCVITNQIINVEWLYLSSDGHKRIIFNWKDKEPEFKWKIP